ncbi:hypothetical protein [Aneurinibacillus migulanus]|uniref:Uncharacterized protein n=1 Tax=Aneurinibacillus migulanus TaxID=47500 RepID=A0A1G8PI27_ANEMI|nr:hypothetical protein [Aneurinibacillus migulanus]MED0892865.1 hypothetical protein [Aneurinibacillus migulanus]MED1619111.1 hypothetical protein [Aneurinibacillus migulanus]GED14001.1 hypothetical protein AMI01nite_19920 [Aneurinibacillus migulanus]SDI92164.1 hypothetical protein SAMN04487909_10999 [Aneurinibacillus migulanus]
MTIEKERLEKMERSFNRAEESGAGDLANWAVMNVESLFAEIRRLQGWEK